MLKYFKRQKRQRTVQNDNNVAIVEKRNSLLSTSSFCDEILDKEDSNDAIANEDVFIYNSRLSMSISSIFKDAECMSCFVQYLEIRNAIPLIKFYLDIENFRIAALGQLVKHQQEEYEQEQQTEAHLINEKRRENCNEALQNNIVSGCTQDSVQEPAKKVPELKSLCDLCVMHRMHKSLTDDEKSQIYAETNKKITKCVAHKLKACSEISLLSELSSTSDDLHNSMTHNISAASVKDAIAIYQKYLTTNGAQLFVQLPVTILSEISLLLCKRDEEQAGMDEKLSISANCFDEAQSYVLSELERLFLTDFLQSPFYCKFCLDLINEGAQKLTIFDVLYSEVTLFFFMEFLEQKGERECLDFWTAAINFRKSYAHNTCTEVNIKEQQDDAMIIYQKFFSLQAERRLWLSDKLRSRVEGLICEPIYLTNCFDLALIVVAKYLEKKYFCAFLESDIFEQYVNELKTKIQESQCGLDSFEGNDILDSTTTVSLSHKLSFKSSNKYSNPTAFKRLHRKTLSDCTNETTFGSNGGELFKHISQQNTLLAMDTSSIPFKHLPSHTSMNIDSRQLTDPNLLWRRRNSTNDGVINVGGLKFGRINSLGRYERDFETIESFSSHGTGKHTWTLGVSGNKIKNAMRKLVNLPEHKAQEEIAWQIAEMIVKDVTSVTLKNSPLGHDDDRK